MRSCFNPQNHADLCVAAIKSGLINLNNTHVLIIHQISSMRPSGKASLTQQPTQFELIERYNLSSGRQNLSQRQSMTPVSCITFVLCDSRIFVAVYGTEDNGRTEEELAGASQYHCKLKTKPRTGYWRLAEMTIGMLLFLSFDTQICQQRGNIIWVQ